MTINEFLFKLDNPQVFTGLELNAVHHPVEEIRSGCLINICLVFPDKYEIGMSNQGLIILYHLLNRMPGVNAERCFLPGRPSIAAFKEFDVPLFSLESRTPLKDFDMIGFSLLSEMTYTNVLQILDLAQIPLLSKDRENAAIFPLIASGGISVVNPEPLRDFVDCFGIGDGEDIFPDLVAALAENRPAMRDSFERNRLLKTLDGIKSLYVPVLHPPVKRGRFYVPDLAEGSVKKRVKRNLDDNYLNTETPDLIVPLTSVVFDRLTVEIARGCPQNCRFCQAKSYYAPYRTRSVENNIRFIKEGLIATGFECFSLSSLSAGDYPDLGSFLEQVPALMPPGVSFSLPSLRPSTLSHHLLSTIALFKRTGITIVPEAGTTRLRKVINKDVTDEEIYQAVELALRNRWQKIKLYFMLGLPTETMEDVDGIVRMILKINLMTRAAKQKVKIHASFSSFVPKPQTPLQWSARAGVTDVSEKVAYLKQHLKSLHKNVLSIDYHAPVNGMVETILTRGDYRVGHLLMEAFKKGEIFSAWDNDFNFSVWAEMIEGSEYEIFLDEIGLDEPLPWDFMQVNFKKEYMKDEYKKAMAAQETPDCGKLDCKTCNGCDFKMARPVAPVPMNPDAPALINSDAAAPPKSQAAVAEQMDFKKIRFTYRKTGDFIFMSHLSMMKYLERLVRRTGITFRCSEGFTPRMKLTTLPALPVFAESLCETAEVFLDAAFSETEILERLNRSSAKENFPFIEVLDCSSIPTLNKDLRLIRFDIRCPQPEGQAEAIRPMLAETDALAFDDHRLILSIDYSKQGQERFAKIYKTIDPDKQLTRNLTRTAVTFKSSEPGAVTL